MNEPIYTEHLAQGLAHTWQGLVSVLLTVIIQVLCPPHLRRYLAHSTHSEAQGYHRSFLLSLI